MELYRVFPYKSSARSGEPGHPNYLFRGQTAGRWDNSHAYLAWYLSRTAAGAIGETFGNLAHWSLSMFDTPYVPGARRALAVFNVPDALPLLDLDDPAELVKRSVRPSQIVRRNIGFTQPFALSAFREQNPDGSRRWAGLTWWSFHRPIWTNAALWATDTEPSPLALQRVEQLDLDHPAIVDASAELVRTVA